MKCLFGHFLLFFKYYRDFLQLKAVTNLLCSREPDQIRKANQGNYRRVKGIGNVTAEHNYDTKKFAGS